MNPTHQGEHTLLRHHVVLALASLLLAVGCAPPPLPVDTDDGAVDEVETVDLSIEFVFPHNGLTQSVCPNFFVSVDIDGIDLVDFRTNPDPVDGEGHWHLTDDITGDYFALDVPYGSLSADLNGQTSRNYSLSATINQNDHTPFNTTEYPDSLALVEFTVEDSPDCIGGSSGGMDTGY